MMMVVVVLMTLDCGMQSPDTRHSCETAHVVNGHLLACVVTTVFDYSSSREKAGTPAYPSAFFCT